MKITKRLINWLNSDPNHRIDYTVHYSENKYSTHEGRLSLRYNPESREYEFFVFWERTGTEEIKYTSRDLKEVVEWANKFMRKIGYYDWNDVVED